MASPFYHRLLHGIVIKEVVPGNIDIKSLSQISLILGFQGKGIIFGMARNENPPQVL